MALSDLTSQAKSFVYNGNKAHYQKMLDKFNGAEQELLGDLFNVQPK